MARIRHQHYVLRKSFMLRGSRSRLLRQPGHDLATKTFHPDLLAALTDSDIEYAREHKLLSSSA